MNDDEEDLKGAGIEDFVTKVQSLPGCANVDKDEIKSAAPLFLRARKGDVDRAVDLYKANKRMRYTENVEIIDPLEDGVRRELLSGKFTILPFLDHAGTLADDENFATVAIFTAHRHWPPMTTHRDTLKGVLYQLDVALMDKRAQRNGLIVLYDMRDAKYGNFDYHLCVKLLNLFKGVYPARLRKVIIVEAPIWFRAPFGVLRLFVKEKIRDRIYTVDFDDIHNHLPSPVVQAVFNQLNEHRHFDWLRSCLEKTGHAAKAPENYFVASPPVYTSLNEFDLLHCPSRRIPGYKSPRHVSLRYSQSIRLRRSSHENEDLNRVRRCPSDVHAANASCMLTSMYNGVSTRHADPRWSSLRLPKNRIQNNNSIHTSSTAQSSAVYSPNWTLNVTNPHSPTRLSVAEFLARVESLGSIGLCAEFDVMLKDKPVHGTCDRFMQTENRRRNRYLDVPCLDATAVELSDGTYLHANWVNGYSCPRAYILAQGPLDNTRRDFWCAVWEYRVPVIVMLTRVVEGQRVKCTPYWPSRASITSNCSSSGTPTMLPFLRTAPLDLLSSSSLDTVCTMSTSVHFGEFHLTNIGESMEENGLYRRTRLELRRRKKDSKRSSKRSSSSSKGTLFTDDLEPPLVVDHLLYLGWPDYDVPSDSEGFLKFLRIVKDLHRSRCEELKCNESMESDVSTASQCPLLVHCSAGIGRTGTFVTVDICLEQALAEGFVDVPEVVSHLRTQRAGAVQVAKQYAFIHTALASSLSTNSRSPS